MTASQRSVQTTRVVALRGIRAAMLRGTALQAAAAIAAIVPAAAQPAPDARPQGGQVVAGAASIQQNAAMTRVDQASQRAAVDWRSFDVGRDHAVTFAQPNASAVVLNRVTGPDPSAIAGRIQANGHVIITNQSGVVFHRGAQVDAQALVVSAPGITNQNFMAGRMMFDQRPRPDARVENHGAITVKETGLAALVAPQVSNSGTISAKLGRAVLGGAETHTLDLYGDGLLSLDVTNQVRQAPRGADGRPAQALVTNTGTVVAEGGVVQLTAAAADGLVQTLVRAGGRIEAPTAAGRRGRIEVSGNGGSVVVEGSMHADGQGPNDPGGEVVVMASGTVGVAGGASVSASGNGGGGTVALGTTLARAGEGRAAALAPVGGKPPGVPAGTARRVAVAPGTRVTADGRGQGRGGTVAVLSKANTHVAGKLSARGGPVAGDGGVVEASSAGTLRLDAAPDVTASNGRGGTVFLDPENVEITNAPAPNQPEANFNFPGGGDAEIPANETPPQTGTSYVLPATLEDASRRGTVTIRIQSRNNLTVSSDVNLATGFVSSSGATFGASLELQAGNDIAVNADIQLGTGPRPGTNLASFLKLLAGNNISIGRANFGTGGAGQSNVRITAGGDITFRTGDSSINAAARGGSILIRNNSVLASGSSLFVQSARDITLNSSVRLQADNVLALQAGGLDAASFNPNASVFIGANSVLTANAIGLVSGLQGVVAFEVGSTVTTPLAPVPSERSIRRTPTPLDGVLFVQSGTGGTNIGGRLDASSLILNSGGDTAQSVTGAIVAGQLSGRARSYALTSNLNRVNSISGISPDTPFAEVLLNEVRGILGPAIIQSVTERFGRFSPDVLFTNGLVTDFGGVELVFTNDAPLQITGRVSAPFLAITAQGGIILDEGITATAEQSGSLPASGRSYLRMQAGEGGTGQIVRTDTTSVVGLNGSTATVRLELPPSGGSMTFNGLQAGTTDVVLNLGRGSASGRLDARSLLVIGTGGSSGLRGRVGGLSGLQAARAVRIETASGSAYRFNNCVIASVSCGPPPDLVQNIVTPQKLLQPDRQAEQREKDARGVNLPLLIVNLQPDPEEQEVLLPNISDRDN